MPLTRFHPAVARWFTNAFAQPTASQAAAWPAILDQRHTLIAAPTGSGKTLAAFLAAIDGLVRLGMNGQLADETHVIYVSPLKALSNDIERNLQWPLAGVRAELKSLGLPDIDIRVQVRTGDTKASDRAAMVKRPPHILVTTPESLYLLLTAESGRRMLATARTVIVDEIHALVASKRGSHLALSLERLVALCAQPIVRIGLSATQKPIDTVARFLVGSDALSGDGTPACAIVDTGHTRDRDLALELPGAPLEAVMSTEVWGQLYDRLAELIRGHRTTLVFVNTRRLAERVARHLSERLGAENVTAHHGSLAKEQRLAAEHKLKSGALQALVATASLELGIDIGDVDLVCQIGSPRSIATFLQRVGRANHAVTGVPKGRLFPLSRDELIECVALLDAVRRDELDQLRVPEQPLDVLAQQIVAEVAARDYGEDKLYALVRRAWPYRDLPRTEFDAVVRMLADGYSTRRGRRSAYLHRDAVNRRLRGRDGARLTALTCGGAIPDNADYRVVLEPAGTFIGTVNEDFAIESMAGDIFQLGNTSYRIQRVEPGRVRVEDAHGAPPSIPFWLGEAPARTDALSRAVSRLRTDLDARLPHIGADSIRAAGDWLASEMSLGRSATDQIVDYLAAAKGVLGLIPTQERLVLERFFDESGGMQLVIHAPFGSRINRAFGLALRKRFCRQFNFELQAAATEDAIVLSLGETHSFALDEVARYLNSRSVRAVLTQALLDAPLFATRWRWNATVALAIKRYRGGQKRPAALQRMDADDLVTVIFPDQLACAENLAGEREVPDHPLVKQTIDDCLYEAMDVNGLVALLTALERGEIQVIARDLPHPSPLAQEILNAKPYAFLDDAPLEERRTQAVMSRRWLDPFRAADIGRLDPQAIAQVRTEAWPQVTHADELHDALMLLGCITEDEGRRSNWSIYLEELMVARRATRLHRDANDDAAIWVAAEQLPMLRALYPDAQLNPRLDAPEEYARRTWTREAAALEVVRGRLQGVGPTTADDIAASLGVPHAAVDVALLALEGEGFALRGQFTQGAAEKAPTLIPSPAGEGGRQSERAARDARNTEWCERRLLARIHRYTVHTLRAEIEPATTVDFLRFLCDWHGLTLNPRPEGPQALAGIVEQLEGFEAAAVAWESDLLSARLHDYDPQWLDSLCLAGRVTWARLTPPRGTGNNKERGPAPVRATPVALLTRSGLPAWRAPVEDGAHDTNLSANARRVAAYVGQHGASFFDDIALGAGLLRSQAEDALAELVAVGRMNSDGFGGLRALLVPADRRTASPRRHRRTSRGYPSPSFPLPLTREREASRRASRGFSNIEDVGRWVLMSNGPPSPPLPPQAIEMAPTLIPSPAGEGGSPIPTPSPASEGRERAERATRDLLHSEPGALARDSNKIEHIARVLLRRYGVVFRRLLERESAQLPTWYELLRVYRRLEARGEIRGGRFVAGVTGEQYALPEAVGALRALRKQPKTGTLVSVSAADPLNLVGIVTPGTRVPALAGNRVLYRDGEPIALRVGGETRLLSMLDPESEWTARNALIRQSSRMPLGAVPH